MSKWIAEFELEDGDTMPEHMDLEYKGVRIDFHCKPLEQEPTIKNDCAEQNGCITCSLDDGDDCCRKLYEESMKKPTTKNNFAVDCIDRVELLKAMDTWDKFGNDPNEGPIPLNTPALQDRYVPYVKYDDMANCVKGMASVIPYKPTITKAI